MQKIRQYAVMCGNIVLAAPIVLATVTTGALASQPLPWQLGNQPPVTSSAEEIVLFHDYLLWLIIVISLFVLLLMVYVCIRFRAANNPNPSRTTHNTLIEVLWTVVPVIILVIVAVPSFRVLYLTDRIYDPDMTIKVTANQWYWTYEYPDDGIVFDSYMVEEDDIDPQTQTYLLSADNPLVVPTGRKIQVLVTSNDVMHSFFVPAAVVQIYGIAGRINETWMEFTKEGTVYGQCNQICGRNHSAMPIEVKAVSEEAYEAWVAEAKTRFAAASAPIRMASDRTHDSAMGMTP